MSPSKTPGPQRLFLPRCDPSPSSERRLWRPSHTSGGSALSRTGCYCGWFQGTPKAAGQNSWDDLQPSVYLYCMAALLRRRSAGMTVGNNGCMWTCEQSKKWQCMELQAWLVVLLAPFIQADCLLSSPKSFTCKPEGMQVHRSALTFPAPTGPMTVRSWCDFTVTEMFCRDGASKLCSKPKTPEHFSIFTSLCTTQKYHFNVTTFTLSQ